MDNNRPRGREKNVTGPARKVEKRGQGLGTGPVGESGGYSERGQGQSGSSTRSTGTRSGGGIKLIALLLAVLLGGGGGLAALFGGQSGTAQQPQSGSSVNLSALLGGLGGGSVSSGWQSEANTGKLNTSVASNARAKYTQLLGNGLDTATIMVYMCGTDLESRSGMGTADLQEMLGASFGDNINLLVCTGGCKGWKNSAVSSSVNQIWQVKGGQLVCLQKDLGAVPMTDPDMLSGCIRWCAQNYPASRYGLILWDHGGGSVSGYGYDEKFASSGSMSLAGVNKALTDAGMKFDFIGFDACLMATAETAMMLSRHADYLIASEETEPGVGWYYTDWLTDFGKNTSMPTIELGQKIVDTFVDTCAQKCPGQLTTLSVVDLAEVEVTLPDALAEFSMSTSGLIQAEKYQTVASARNGAREFAASSKIDQVDLVHLAQNMKTPEGDALVRTLLSAVKYNRTSSNMTNAYGISIYFPYQKTATVQQAVSTYEELGMDYSYGKCIQDFASIQQAGQVGTGGSASPLDMLLGLSGGGSVGGADAVSALLQAALSSGLLSDRSLDLEHTAQYVADNHLDDSDLVWKDGVLTLSQEQWNLVQTLELNVFYDDGEGFLDLGLDNVYEFDENGGLKQEYDGTWLAINGQPVAYYHTATVDDGTNYTITGRVPVLHNGERAELILVFDNDTPYGYVAGVQRVYKDGETDTVAKAQEGLQPGDVLEFVCDCYTYDGDYQDSYLIGEPLAVTGEALTISNVPLEGQTRASYRVTDLYNHPHWTPVIQ